MKKLFMVFSIVVITLLCSISVFAMDTDDSGKWEYETYGNGVELTGYNGTQTDVYIPSKITKGDTEYSVLKLGDELFKGNTSLNSATLGEGITEIGVSAFEGATNLVCIVTNETLTTIGNRAFSGCTSFNSVILYNAVTSIGDNAFAECPKVTVYCNENSVAHKYVDSNNIIYEILKPDATTKIVVIEGIEYYINNGKAAVVSYDGSVGDVVLPSTVYGRPLTDVNIAFQFSSDLKSIVIPNSVTYIQPYAFESCSNLVSVGLPDSMTSIGEAAFIQCTSLKNIDIPDGVIVIGDLAFQSCESIESIEIPDSVTSLGSYSFTLCKSLKNIKIPNGLTSIEDGVFNSCPNLLSIDIPNSVNHIGWYAFDGCSNLTNIELPYNITDIGHGAFRGCKNVESVEIPSSVKTMYPDSFDTNTLLIVYKNSKAYNIALENNFMYFVKNGDSKPEIYKKDGVKYYIFNNKAVVLSVDSSLTDVEIPETIEGYPVTDIRNAFNSHKNIKSVVLPQGITSINDNAFNYCSNLMSVEIPNGVTYIGKNAFTGCPNLESIEIPDSVTTLYSNSFYINTILIIDMNSPVFNIAVGMESDFMIFIKDGDSKPELYNKNGIKYYISNNSAHVVSVDSSSTYVEIPESVEGYPVRKIRNAFGYNYTIKSVVLPQSITTIGEDAFSGCFYLENIEIPEGVIYIGENAFNSCMKLASVKIPASVTTMYSDSFNSNTVLLVYENSPAHTFATRNQLRYIVIDNDDKTPTLNGVTYLIENKKATVDLVDISLTSVIIPETVNDYPVTDIGTAFANHGNIKSVVLPRGITMINDNAFLGCSNLENIEIPDSVISVGDCAFYGCSSLASIEIPDSVTYVGVFAFECCSALKDVKISNGMTRIWTEVFARCKNLENIIIPDNIVEIGQFSFAYCTNLKNVQIPDGVTTIHDRAFDGCVNLKTLIIPKTVTTILEDVFPASTILCVYENSYAHNFAVKNNLLYFIIRETENPEISYGSDFSGTATYTDGTVVSGATVEILYDDGTVKETVTTDEAGAYSFTYAEVGRYTIRVTDSDGNTASEVVSVKRMNVFDVYVTGETDLVLKKGYNVSGTVSPETAKITISDTSGNIIKSVDVTDGAFAFSNIPRGTYIVKAENENASATTEIYVSDEDVTGISLKIEAQSATITGDTKIENRDGIFTAKIWVNIDLIDSNGNVVASTKTDAEGKYTFENLPLGSYNIVATTNEMRPDLTHGFDKSHELKGYGHVDVTEFTKYTIGTITLREDKVNLTSVSGKVTANGITQDCQVILTNETGDQIAVFITGNNGKYSFVNIPDGMYCITAITKVDGMGFAVITIENGVVHGDTDIKVVKADKISKREPVLLEEIPDCETTSEALVYKKAILGEKAFYDSLSDNERKQLSQEWIEKLFKLVGLLSDSSINTPDGVTVENEGSIISTDEMDEKIHFVLTVTETDEVTVGEDGITTAEEYESEKIRDKGNDKEIVKYYDITFSKDGQNISNIQKQTETNGKLRITMEIPKEYRGHKHYSFIHMHNGEAVTLVDLDDDPSTVTFEIDKFSTFALAYSDVELVGEVEEETYPASISYNNETGKISVSSTETGKLYIATYDGNRMIDAKSYDVIANELAKEYDFASNQAAFVWDKNIAPLCEKFTLGN